MKGQCFAFEAMMPKFSYDYETELSGSLKQLGMKRAFTDRSNGGNYGESHSLIRSGKAEKRNSYFDNTGFE